MILMEFYLSGYLNPKHFYVKYIQVNRTKNFPHTVSNNRFVELQLKAL
jgi:hypothetical protein